MRFTPKTPVKDLWASLIDAKPQDYDFSEGYPEKWEYFEAERCEECGNPVLHVRGEDYHNYLDDDTECEGYVNADGPMMNYMYPIRCDRVGGVEGAMEALVDLPLCIVKFEKLDGHFMALTGGGMDLSWQICEAYMRLGYLPPTHFAGVPRMAGKTLNTRNKWILAGCNQAVRVQIRWLRGTLRDIKTTREFMREEVT